MSMAALWQVAADSAAGAADSVAAPPSGVLTFPGLNVEVGTKLTVSVVAIFVLFLMRRGVMGVVDRRVDDATLRYRWSKGSGYAVFVLGLLVVVEIWFTALMSLGTFLGLATAGVAIALKDLVADLAGWVFILWRKPFDLGDRIQIGPHAGDVVDIRIFAFTILEVGNWVAADQSTGRLIHVPNALVLSGPLANYTAQFPFIWNEIPVRVTFESDWQVAKLLLQTIGEEATGDVTERAEQTLRRTASKYLIHYKKLTPVVYTSVDDRGVVLTLRYLCDPRKRRGTAQAIWEEVLNAFGRSSDIHFAYPTQRWVSTSPDGDAHGGAPLSPKSPAP